MPAVPDHPVPAPAAWLGFAADVLMAIGLSLVLGLLAYLAWLLAGGQGREPGVVAQMGMAVVSTGGAAVLLYLGRRRASVAEKQASLAAMYRPRTWLWAVGGGLAVSVLSNLLGMLLSAIGHLPAPTNTPLMVQSLHSYPWLLVAFAVFLAPFYEELLFRRVLFGRLAGAGFVGSGLLLSSLLFAFSHELPGVSGTAWGGILALWLIYGAMGAGFAWIYHRTGTLLAPVVAHGINNGLALLLLGMGLTTP